MGCKPRLAIVIVAHIGAEHRAVRRFRAKHIVEHGRRHGRARPIDRLRRVGRAEERELLDRAARELCEQAGHRRHRALAVDVLVARAAADHEAAASLHVRFELRRARFGDDRRVRVKHRVVAAERRRGARVVDIDEIKRDVRALQRLEKRVHAAAAQRAVPLVLDAVPLVVVVAEHGDLRRIFRAGDALDLPEVLVRAPQLREAAVVAVVVVQKAVPVHFRAERAGAPAEVADEIRAVRDGLERPQPQLAGLRRRLDHARVPAAGAGLLLHDAEARRDAARPDEVVRGLAVAQRFRRELRRVEAERKVRVAVVRHEVEVLARQAVVVEHAENAVRRDELLRPPVFFQDLRLQADVADRRLGDEPALLEHHVRIRGIRQRVAREVDLVPARVRLVPEHRAHRAVQVLERAVFFAQVRAERRVVAFGVVARRLAVHLVVDLPADDRRVRAVVLRDVLGHAADKAEVRGRRHVVVLAHAVPHRMAVDVAVQNLRVLLGHPRGRRRRRRAENDPHPAFRGEVEKCIPEAVVEAALLRLKEIPRELGHADHADAVFPHAAQIVAPEAFVPVLGVIAHPELDFRSVQKISHTFLPKAFSAACR